MHVAPEVRAVIRRLIVVDANPATLRRAEEALSGAGFRFAGARDLAEALRVGEAGGVDVALVALRLPGGNGYDAARRIRDNWPASLIFILAGGFDVVDEARLAESGADGRVAVPFSPRGLRARVEEALGPLTDGLPELGAADISPVGESPRASVLPPPPASDERLATFLPRDFRQPEPVSVDPAVVGPALERAILEVLPEVVENVLRNALLTSPQFRDIVARAVEKAVAQQIAARR